eukprot:Pgem_evm1s6104
MSTGRGETKAKYLKLGVNVIGTTVKYRPKGQGKIIKVVNIPNKPARYKVKWSDNSVDEDVISRAIERVEVAQRNQAHQARPIERVEVAQRNQEDRNQGNRYPQATAGPSRARQERFGEGQKKTMFDIIKVLASELISNDYMPDTDNNPDYMPDTDNNPVSRPASDSGTLNFNEEIYEHMNGIKLKETEKYKDKTTHCQLRCVGKGCSRKTVHCCKGCYMYRRVYKGMCRECVSGHVRNIVHELQNDN